MILNDFIYGVKKCSKLRGVSVTGHPSVKLLGYLFHDSLKNTNGTLFSLRGAMMKESHKKNIYRPWEYFENVKC